VAGAPTLAQRLPTLPPLSRSAIQSLTHANSQLAAHARGALISAHDRPFSAALDATARWLERRGERLARTGVAKGENILTTNARDWLLLVARTDEQALVLAGQGVAAAVAAERAVAATQARDEADVRAAMERMRLKLVFVHAVHRVIELIQREKVKHQYAVGVEFGI
jgi:hypothetical protein